MKTKMTATEQFESHYGVKIVKNKDNRTTSETLIIGSLFEFAKYSDVNLKNLIRYVAAIETVLIMEGVLKPGQKFEPKVAKSKFLFWEIEAKETYHELMQRMGLDYLKERGVVE